MEIPFESAKGVSEKLSGMSSPTVLRVLLPGVLATAVLYPALRWGLAQIPSGAEYSWQKLAVYAGIAYLLGVLISMVTGEIYKLYEGRNWPGRLFERGRLRHSKRVRSLRETADAAVEAIRAGEAKEALYNETWDKLLAYPTDDNGDPTASHPTRLGNILNGYEQYPVKRYGIDSIFFWPRLWLEMDKDKKEEIDQQWAVADGLLMLSAVSGAGGMIWIAQAIAKALWDGLPFRIPFDSPVWAAAGSIGWILLSYAWYRASLPMHVNNGKLYKSIFDLYRGKIWDITSLKPDEKEVWNATWSYLQYETLVCPNCKTQNFFGLDHCSYCGIGLKELKEGFRKSGKFPI